MIENIATIATFLGIETATLWYLIAISWVCFIYCGFKFNSSASDTYFNKWFSKSFIKTYKIVFFFFAFFAWWGGTADNLAISYSKYATSIYIGELLGTLLALVFIPLLLTFFVRLLIPFLEWIYKKTQ
tara:strand:+ start:77 stop:460 length:384 start_codon:yes stop_codon:yes gene_type:complete